MTHFKLHEWVDFARNMLTAEQKSGMQRHLAEGCGECQHAARFWEQVGSSAMREKKYAPPDSVLRSVRGHFALQRPSKSTVLSRMKLVFDSLMNPAPVGVRSSGASARQLLYRNGNYSVDLRVELQADSGRIAMVGQVLDSGEPAHGIGDIPVSLQGGDGGWQGMTTNHLGEFHFECPQSDSLQLSLGVNPKRTLVVSIPLVPDTPSPRHML
jgi:hypothetical protein